jgi:hypothetical protein
MSETTYRDQWGQNLGIIPALPTEPKPYTIEDAGGGVTYICYFPDDENGMRAIKRITQVSEGGATTTTVEHAYGAWADRATLTYYPINQAIPVSIA